MNFRAFPMAFLSLSVTTATAVAQTNSTPNEGALLSRGSGAGAFTFSWWGCAGRTYFLQQSGDLQSWAYLPTIEAGSDQIISWSFVSTSAQGFMRLRYTDISTNDPYSEDFNGDGLSNWDNLLQGTDPLAPPVLDTNGLPLNWELFYNVPIGTDPTDYTLRGDSTTYQQAFEQRLNPNDYYNGGPVAISVVSGDNQGGSFNSFLAYPVVVHVSDAETGTPWVNSPVTFTSATALLSSFFTYVYRYSTLDTRTDDQGNAHVYVTLPASGLSHLITAIPTGSASATGVVFHATVVQLSTQPQTLTASVDNGETVTAYFSVVNHTANGAYYSLTPTPTNLIVAPSETPQDAANPGYNWIDSDHSGGPDYVWNDISVTGTKLDAFSLTSQSQSQQINLGFGFPFFDKNYLSVWICSNGYLDFTGASAQSYGHGLPNSGTPQNIIAPFLYPLTTINTGNVYYQLSGNKMIVQYDKVGSPNSTDIYTFQVVLDSAGGINCYYNTMSGSVASATVGIQDGSTPPTGRQVSYGQNYVHNSLAVKLYPVAIQPPPWLQLPGVASGYLPGGQSARVPVRFSGVAISPGTYTASLLLQDGIGGTVGPNIPVTMTATGKPLIDSDYDGLADNWEVRYFGNLGQGPNDDPDKDGLTNLTEYQQGTDPTDYYNGNLPSLLFVGGADQRGAPTNTVPRTALPIPLSIKVGAGSVSNAPVNFTVKSGYALISPSNDPVASPPTTALQVYTGDMAVDASGRSQKVAQVYVYLPNLANDVSLIEGSVIAGGQMLSVSTSATSIDTGLNSPSNLMVMPTGATTVSVSWALGDATHSTTLQGSTDGVNWFTIGVTRVGSSAAVITGMTPDVTTYFRAFTGGDYVAGSDGAGGTFTLSSAGGSGIVRNGGSAGGSGSSPAAAVTPVSVTTLLSEQTTDVKERVGAAGFNPDVPGAPVTRYLTVDTSNKSVEFDSFGNPYPDFTGWRETITDIDKDTRAQTTRTIHNEGRAVEVSGNFPPWTIVSDALEKRHGDGQYGSYNDDSITLSHPNEPSELMNPFNSYVPKFKNIFVNTYLPQAALNSPEPQELGYNIQSLQYKWLVVPEPLGAVFWNIPFYPNMAGPAKNNFYCWQTKGDANSPVYKIDPTQLNHKQTGSYYVFQQPADVIQVEAFIPQEYVEGPIPYDFPANGNYKKTPMDASYSGGYSLFFQDKESEDLKYKLFETISATTFSQDDSVNVNDDSDTVIDMESSTNNIKQGETRKYKETDLVSGHLTPDTIPVGTAKGIPTTLASTTHPGLGKVQVNLSSYGNDPFVPPSTFAPIYWNLTITIDRSTYPATYAVTGSHKQFPAYVVFINGQQVYMYDPIPYNRGPKLGLLFNQEVTEHGKLQ